MLKRKYGDRSDWKRVIEKSYAQTFLDTKEFKGYVSLLNVHQVTEPLFTQYEDKRICLVDDGYTWLQHFPMNQRFSLTSMFNEKGHVVQWYIDICYRNGVANNIPWMEDLFLYIIVLPTGEVIQKDREELEEALVTGVINQSIYECALDEAARINHLIQTDRFDLFKLSNKHKEWLVLHGTYT
ncbi:DUF402 domain-containing protein [Fictibacillus nanhaiensis]|nr:DUF402 domain-containing protein [Fictibacillus nanhaiensis]